MCITLHLSANETKQQCLCLKAKFAASNKTNKTKEKNLSNTDFENDEENSVYEYLHRAQSKPRCMHKCMLQ